MYDLCVYDRRFKCDMILMGFFFYQIQLWTISAGDHLLGKYFPTDKSPTYRLESKHFPKWVGLYQQNEQPCMCVLSASILPLLRFVLLYLGTVPTVWCYTFFS